MSAIVNFTFNGSSPIIFLQSVNSLSSGMLGNVLPFIIFFVALGYFMRTEAMPKQSFMFASMAALTISVLLAAGNLLNAIVLVLFILLAIINIFVMLRDL